MKHVEYLLEYKYVVGAFHFMLISHPLVASGMLDRGSPSRDPEDVSDLELD